VGGNARNRQFLSLTVEEFKEKIENHEITGHVGLEQSI